LEIVVQLWIVCSYPGVLVKFSFIFFFRNRFFFLPGPRSFFPPLVFVFSRPRGARRTWGPKLFRTPDSAEFPLFPLSSKLQNASQTRDSFRSCVSIIPSPSSPSSPSPLPGDNSKRSNRGSTEASVLLFTTRSFLSFLGSLGGARAS